jgi:5'-methylthioadenosine phosphorylase
VAAALPEREGDKDLKAKIGIIGGSGLYSMPGFSGQQEVRQETPFGDPSDAYISGEIEGKPVAFLARHGRGHRFSPSEINYRANIYGFKQLGVEWIISLSAVGSLRAEHKPLDFVIPDQFVDRTMGRKSTFFGEGLVAHVSFGDPVCGCLAQLLKEACTEAGVAAKLGGTYVCMEGPAFSTKAESNLYRSWGMDVIGMTNLQEAKLAREAEICYSTAAMVTDYDCWHPDHDSVTVADIIRNLTHNAENARKVVRAAVRLLDTGERSCGCSHALEYALLTDRSTIPAETRKKLELIVGKYLG